jgi:hypothetical protein
LSVFIAHSPRRRARFRIMVGLQDASGSRLRSPSSTARCSRQLSRASMSSHPTDIRSRAPTEAPRGARATPRTSTWLCPTDIRSHAPTVAPRDARPTPRARTSSRSTGIRSRATTAAPRGARPAPPMSTSFRPTGSRLRATTSQLRVALSPPLTVEDIPTTPDDLVDAGALACLSTQTVWHVPTSPFSRDAQSPPPRRASHDSPLEGSRDL